MSSENLEANNGTGEVAGLSTSLASTSLVDSSTNPGTSGKVFIGMKIKKAVTDEEANEKFAQMMSNHREFNNGESLFNQVQVILDDWALSTDMFEAIFGYYNGFDAIDFRNKMIEMLSLEEITLCVTFLLEKGNNLEKILQETGNQELKSIASKIGLKTHAKFKSQVPSLAKITLTFPDVAANVLASLEDKPSLNASLQTLKSMLKVDIPAICWRPCLCCLLPKNAPFVNQVMNLFLFVKLANNTNQNNNKNQSKEEKFVEAKMKQENSLNLKLMNDDVRNGFCKLFGITTETGGLSPIWEVASENAKQYLIANYGKCYDF